MKQSGTSPQAIGLLLAAGSGRRMGLPKALLETAGQPWLERSIAVLLDGGCAKVLVVTGAARREVEKRLPTDPRVQTVHAHTWSLGMGESLAAGLNWVSTHRTEMGTEGPVLGTLVNLVDLIDVRADVVGRVLRAWVETDSPQDALVRATYAGRVGHPVLLGQSHWPRIIDIVHGDVGAQRYFDLDDDLAPPRRLTEVDCSDLATGRDVDRPEELPE